MLANIFRTKPLRVIRAEENLQDLPRTLSLFDLVCIGVGGTVGSGVFATTGDIISGVAGPAAVISWGLAGLLCAVNAFAYMELVTRVPSSGSTYAYAFHALGELPAVIAAWLLTLEYGMSGAGVTRSWSDKMVDWLSDDYPTTDFSWLNAEHTNILAALLMALCVGVLLVGVRFGTLFVNTVTGIKVAVVLFIIVGGLALSDTSNFTPFVPPRDEAANAYGWQGVISGASLAFFGYVGFDEVCCLAAEAKNPRATMPIAVITAVTITMLLSAFASLALSGMADYHDATSFPVGFKTQGADWAATLVRAGEVITMPVGALIGFLAQPRLNYALACDGLMPQIFARVDAKGNLFVNTLLTGSLFVVICFTVPFNTMWDIVNIGILLNFVLGNASLLVVRTRKHSPRKAPIAIAVLVFCAFVAAFTYQKGYDDVASEDRSTAALVVVFVFLVGTVLACAYLALYCPQEELEPDVYRAPLVPYLPALSILGDFYMMAQLSNLGLQLSFAWIGAALLFYFCYGYGNSAGRSGWASLLHYQPHSTTGDHHEVGDGHKEARSSAASIQLSTSEMLSPVATKFQAQHT